MKDPRVGDLQAALPLLRNQGGILAIDQGAQRELFAALSREHTKRAWNEATRKLVRIFQEEQRLAAGGTVDEQTATALNRLLDQLDGTGGEQPQFVVKGTVRLFNGFPAAGLVVSAFDRDLRIE